MHTARTVLCCALLGLAGQAGADDTPYKHEYLNGGYFEGVPEVAQPSSPGPTTIPRATDATPYRHSYRNGGSFNGQSAAPGGNSPLKQVQTRE